MVLPDLATLSPNRLTLSLAQVTIPENFQQFRTASLAGASKSIRKLFGSGKALNPESGKRETFLTFTSQ